MGVKCYIRMGNDEITIQNNTTHQVESFLAEGKTIKGKKNSRFAQFCRATTSSPEGLV